MADLIDDPAAHFRALPVARSETLRALEHAAAREDLPIVGPALGALLEVLVRSSGARRVLELGTAGGYSALWLAQGMTAGGTLLTIESDPARAAGARVRLHGAAPGIEITVQEGTAPEVLHRLAGPYDLIFMDVDKAHYRPCLEPCAGLLRPGGLLVVDNVAFREAEDFSRALAADARFVSVQLLALLPGHAPEQDALALAVRR